MDLTSTKLSNQLCGITGEYYVAAELSRRNHLAAVTLRNSDGVDILVSNIAGDKLASIQVKTTVGKQKWILNKKVESEVSENKYFVFVSLPMDLGKNPDYFIIKSKNLSSAIFSGHRAWLGELGKNGKKRNDSDVRQFDPRNFKEDELLTWEGLIHLINQ